MKYPLGIQTFSKIIEDKALYIDKTAIIHDLISQGSVYFLSRPRRFGKSLLVSTLDALFSGNRDLFEGLHINNTDYSFTTHPVVKLEFSKVQVTNADDLKNYIITATRQHAARYDIELAENSYELQFDELISKLHQSTGKKAVLLIDEYDKPILSNIDKPQLESIKNLISAFYAVAKSLDEHLHFVFITGVSKFAKVSVFSGMNNLIDISMDRRYATLCGITGQELESNFEHAINEQAKIDNLSYQQTFDKIKTWYNGYQFHHNAQGVYNPYSLLSLCVHQEFKNYWFTTATPTFLLKLIEDQRFELSDLDQFEIGESAFSASEPEKMDVLSVLVQTGYLTIKGYNNSLYTLDFPNYEVKKSFYDSIVGYFSHLNTGLGQTYTVKLIEQLKQQDVNAFINTLKQFFANIPYDLAIGQEKYFQSLFYAIFTLVGLSIEAEVRTNQGRIDCVVQTHNTIYIIEFKLNDTAKAALKQIQDKQYSQKYENSCKKIILLGVEFDQETRNIEAVEIQ